MEMSHIFPIFQVQINNNECQMIFIIIFIDLNIEKMI